MTVFYPESEKDILDLIHLARTLGRKIHVVSKGKNWGYGSAQGTTSGQIIVDLSKMNQVMELDESLGTVRIQPGVTQGQLSDHLQKSNSRLQADVTGAGPDTSVMGNTLERGYGHSDYADRFANIISLRVILPNGKIIETGYGAYKNARTKQTFRTGVGPVLDGLFTQSNFGIVTAMTIRLQPRPAYFCLMVGVCKAENDLMPMIQVLKELQLNGTITGFVQIANLKRAVGQTDINVKGAWGVSVAISGPKALVKARKKVIKSAFAQMESKCNLLFLNDLKISIVKWWSRNIYPIKPFDNLAYLVDLKKGIPSNEPLKILLNQQSANSNLNPKSFKDRFRWICATSPANPTDVALMYAIAKEQFRKYGFELRVTFSFVNPRTVVMIASLNYDNTEKAIERADKLYFKCRTELLENGFFPYRSGSGMFEELTETCDTNTKVLLKAIKTIVDPENILSPGKYNI